MNKQRHLLPDILKGLAVLLMIQVHLMELFARQEIFDGLAGKISLFFGGPPAAPVFMAVMGYFLARSVHGFRTDIIRGFKLLLWGLLLNLGMNAHLLIKILSGAAQLNAWPYVFGVDILFVAGLSTIIIALFRSIFQNHLLSRVVLAMFVAVAASYLPAYAGSREWIGYVQAFFWGNAPWSYFPFFPWAFYPLVGYIFYTLDERYKLSGFTRKGLIYIASALFLLLALSFSWGFGIASSLQQYYHHSLLFTLWALIFLAFWVIMVRLFSTNRQHSAVPRYLQWVGRYVTNFYVFQWLIIGNLATAVYKTQAAGALVLWFVAIVAATSGLVYLWRKVKAGGRVIVPH